MSDTAMNATTVWVDQLRAIIDYGDKRSPRGMPTLDLTGTQVVVNMMRPVVALRERKLSYRFMAAEAHWILSGSDRVDGIAPWNKNIAKFSDDGETFFGAYGPKVVSQLDYVVRKLAEDPDSRQAGLTIWRESPPQTKDVPCTVAMFFGLNQGMLDVNVFMRSSDAWLGLPYDIFNFSMVACEVCARLNGYNRAMAAATGTSGPALLQPGNLHLTMASSHLYESSWKEAEACLSVIETPGSENDLPSSYWDGKGDLLDLLKVLRETSPGDEQRWWDHA